MKKPDPLLGVEYFFAVLVIAASIVAVLERLNLT